MENSVSKKEKLDIGSCIRVYWDLLQSVLSPFIDNLPFHDPARRRAKIPKPIALIRSALEWIGANLDPELYFPYLLKISPDKKSEIFEVFYDVLVIFERSVIEDVLNSKVENEQQSYQGADNFPRLSKLRILVHSAPIAGTNKATSQPRRISPAQDYVNMDLDEMSLCVLHTRLETLNKTVSAAFPAILYESHPTPLENSITAARLAQKYGKVAEALFSTVAGQMDGHCNAGRDGFIRIAVAGNPQVDLLLPVCSKLGEVHPTSCFLSAPVETSESLQLDPSKDKQWGICETIRRSKRRKQKLALHFEDNCLWEHGSDFKRSVPFRRDSLSSFIWGDNKPADGANAATFTTQCRAEIPVLLARLMLHLHKTRWFQHLWDMDRLILCAGPRESPRDQHPYLAGALSMNNCNGDGESIFAPNEEECDPLYRYGLILGFGLRLLEIESGRRFPPTDDDMDPEDEEKGALPFLTLQRALDEVKDTGEVEDDYYNIAKACLEFHSNIKKKRFQDIEIGLRELVAIHNLIYSPLLQLLAKKFKAAAADLLELEPEAHDVKFKDEKLENTKGLHVPPGKGLPAVVLTGVEATRISLCAEKLPREKSRLCDQVAIVQVTENSSDGDRISGQFVHILESQPDIHKKRNGEYPPLQVEAQTTTVEANTWTRSKNSQISEVSHLRIEGSTMLYERSESSSESWFEKVDQLNGLLRARTAEKDTNYEDQKVRIAVLDTGISPEDPYAQGMESGMYKDFVNGEDSVKRDADGHGTDTVNLIFRVFETPDVYVARVFKTKIAEENTPDLVAEAILWALGKKVDIVVMALGFPQWHEPIKDAVDAATAAKILIFAAAGNWGGQNKVAFPARLDNVLCMFSTTPWNKNSRDINPPHDKRKTHNFAILGQHVEMPAPPGHLQRFINGTSISSAIAAGLAGSLLDFSRQPICGGQLRGIEGRREVSAIFEDLSKDYRDGNYYCIAPWSLLNRIGDSTDRETKRIKIRDHLSRVLENCR